MAGPFPKQLDPDNPIPLDKKLDAAWVRSLTERGTPTTYRGWEQLKHIGMPIGGIGCGTVYVGGDGKLWCWDIFNEHHEGCIPNQIANEPSISPYADVVRERDGANFVRPTDEQASPWKIKQGFVLDVAGQKRPLDRHGFSDITFRGQYPIADVTYADANCPVGVSLEALTPFIPLDTERSSYPATVMRYTLTNTSDAPVRATLTGYIENPVLRKNNTLAGVQRRMMCYHSEAFHGVQGTAETIPVEDVGPAPREDIVFADFEGEGWGDWQAQGRAFEGGPFHRDDLRPIQQLTGYSGERFVNTYNTRAARAGENPDTLTGSLTSPAFTINRRFVHVAIAGGDQPDTAYVEVVVAGESVGRVTGHGDNALRSKSIDVSAYQGQEARIRIVDQETGGWGQITVDQLVFSDRPAPQGTAMEALPDFGSIAMEVRDAGARTGLWDDRQQTLVEEDTRSVTGPCNREQLGALAVDVELAPGTSQEVTFIVAWHFANTHLGGRKRWYAARFRDASDVAQSIGRDLNELTALTRLWRDTWYGNADAEGNDQGTLPHWLLERTLFTADTLQTNNCYRFDDGRFWAWEGIGCCGGTCTHVWHYAQAVGRLFPELERDLRERTDYGMGFREADGRIDFRGGQAGRDATDGQAGVILRTYREHQASGDDAFLRRIWPKCKKALEFLVAQDARDGEPDGLPVGEQHNTLDAEWFGKVPVLVSLYLAALRAGEEMARAAGDDQAARRYRAIYDRGQRNVMSIYNADFGYFVQEEDPNHLDAIGVGDGCYIDQVMGQWWAYNLGLGRVYDGEAIRSSLHKLWDHNFCPDMGRLRDSIENPGLRGRPYALAGDAGLVMCTWPNGGKRDDWEKHWQYGYFNECMTGFEYQAAGHMVWESGEDPTLLEKGLAITRAIHDRYHAAMRNPYNEIECSDHYARAMSSYSVFLAVCGFEYDGPREHLGFAPKLTPDHFRAPFTAAQGWGAYQQQRVYAKLECRIEVKHGVLRVKTFAAEMAGDYAGSTVTRVTVNGRSAHGFTQDGGRVLVDLGEAVELQADETLVVDIVSEP
ncbi:MAG: GH116 family glycosyl-hydrolase [Planctomycetota bacterium]